MVKSDVGSNVYKQQTKNNMNLSYFVIRNKTER